MSTNKCILLDLLSYQSQLAVKTENKKRFILDVVRKKYLVATPEELVRQLLLLYLIDNTTISKNHISVERALKVNGMLKRWDILIHQKSTAPWMLVECKAPNVKINQSVFEQIATYNLKLKVPYLLVTNGRHTYCAKMDYEHETFIFLDELPNYG